VEGDFFAFESAVIGKGEFASIDKVLDELGVVDHFVSSAEPRVFIFECIETMRAGRNDFLHFIAIEQFNVHECLHLKGKLIAGAFGWVARTAFFGA